MGIKERELRKIRDSVVVILSKEFLESIGTAAIDAIYVDEEKLKDITVKKNMSEHQKKLRQMMENSKQKHNELYKELATKRRVFIIYQRTIYFK